MSDVLAPPKSTLFCARAEQLPARFGLPGCRSHASLFGTFHRVVGLERRNDHLIGGEIKSQI